MIIQAVPGYNGVTKALEKALTRVGFKGKQLHLPTEGWPNLQGLTTSDGIAREAIVRLC
jgi:hypothetical protein